MPQAEPFALNSELCPSRCTGLSQEEGAQQKATATAAMIMTRNFKEFHLCLIFDAFSGPTREYRSQDETTRRNCGAHLESTRKDPSAQGLEDRCVGEDSNGTSIRRLLHQAQFSTLNTAPENKPLANWHAEPGRCSVVGNCCV